MTQLARLRDEPYTDPAEHLADWHELVRALLTRWLARYGHRFTESSSGHGDLLVGPEEALHLMYPTPEDTDRDEEREADRRVAHARGQIRHRLECSMRLGGPDLPIEDLRATFRLTDLEIEALMLAALPTLSVEIGRLTHFLTDRDDSTPTVALIAEACHERPVSGLILEDPLDPMGTLVRRGLVHRPHHDLDSAVQVPGSLISFLRGAASALPHQFASACTLHPSSTARDVQALLLDDLTARRICSALSGAQNLIVAGPPGVGRRTSVRAFLAQRDRPVLEVDLALLLDLSGVQGLSSVQLEARLRGAALLLRAESLFADDARLATHFAGLRDALHDVNLLTAITVAELTPKVRELLPSASDIRFPDPCAHHQRLAWRRATGSEDTAVELARRYQLTVGAIERCVATAEDTSIEALSAAARTAMVHELHSLADPIVTRVTWDQVVLPSETEAKIREVIAHARHRELVFDTWGLGDNMSYGCGLSCMFSGPPGTGKTMMAGLVAVALGRELWRVDVSRLVSKWLGQTEKNLAKVFDEAQRAQAVLLFDEADSLFAKRTQVKGSNDRHANMEVNFLLQKMESHDGVTILTTNLHKGIDEAFLRRIRFRIDFPLPDAAQRGELWRRMLPPRAPLGDDLDCEVLGQEFAMSGGHIKNAMLRAAFSAATRATALNQDTLFEAALAEAREMGHLVRG